MTKHRSRFVPGVNFADDCLERRMVLSGPGGNLAHAGAEVSALSMKKAPTRTTLAIDAGTLGQPIRFTVTVRAAASAGSPLGTVKILDGRKVVGLATLSPAQSGEGRFATSTATYTLTPTPGGEPYNFGQHRVTASFVPAAGYSRSSVARAFNVAQPSYTELAGGVKIASVVPGSGHPIMPGRTAGVLYTGYLARNGRLFDNSLKHGGAPLSFRMGAGQVIPGFDAGTIGMRVGETRIILIPPSQGYGPSANGPIPGNSTLIFLVTLQSIS